jgi:long-chain acyl-CoA synthetase
VALDINNSSNNNNDMDAYHQLQLTPEPIPGSATEGYSATYRNATPLSVDPQLNTLSKLWNNAVKHFGKDDCLGMRLFHNTRKRELDTFYTYQSYNKVDRRKHNIGCGIVYLVTHHASYKETLSIAGKPEFIVSVLSPNRTEWVLVDLATRDFALTNTALYPTLGNKSSQYILGLTESPIVFLTKDQIDKILDIKPQLPSLNIIVSFDEFNHDDHGLFSRAKQLGVSLIDFRAVEKTGERNQLPRDFNPPTPDTIYTISFTSGTTGNPKGVVIPHEMAVAGIISCFRGLASPIPLKNGKYRPFLQNRDDRGQQITALCALPLAHIYEREISNYALASGFRLGMPSSNNPATLFDDVKASKPHYLASVPRVFNKLDSALKSALKAKFSIDGPLNAHPVDNLLVRNYARAQFGFENCRYLISGSAPLGAEVIKYLKDIFGMGFSIAYGSTETYAGAFFGDPFEHKITNSCGKPTPTVNIRLRDVPEMGYTTRDEPMMRGELMIKGPQVFTEYYKNPKATKESFDSEGFFHTGDIVSMDSQGRVYIIDRVKNFFKLAQGEYVTPERIENIYLAHSPILTQFFVHGDSLQNFLVGIAGISVDYVVDMFKKDFDIEVSPDEVISLLRDPKYKSLLIKQMNSHVSGADLQGFEKVHNIHIDLEPLKQEDEVLTPTMKIKRENAKRKFAPVLEKLYKEGSMMSKSKL